MSEKELEDWPRDANFGIIGMSYNITESINSERRRNLRAALWNTNI